MVGHSGESAVRLVQATRVFALWILCAWVAVNTPLSRAQASQSPAMEANSSAGSSGKALFESHRCSGCHGEDGHGSEVSGAPRIGPPSLSVPEFLTFVRSPKGSMPPYPPEALPEVDLEKIYDYLKTIPPPPGAQSSTSGDAAKGSALYLRDGCYECHGRQGQGARHTGAPRIGPPSLGFTDFVNYLHGPKGSMPPYTNNVISESELADIYAFLKSRPVPPAASGIPLLNQ
jgi:mono/diheme cytochrome c family protein